MAKAKGFAFCPGRRARDKRDQGRRAKTEHEPRLAPARNQRGLAGGRYWPRHDCALRRRDRESEDDSLEWAGRDLRDSGLCRGHDRDCGSNREGQCGKDHWRRRLGHGGETVRARRQDDLHFHRRRSFARIAEGKSCPSSLRFREA